MPEVITVQSRLRDYNVYFTDTLESVANQITSEIVFIDANVYNLYPVFKSSAERIVTVDCCENTKSFDYVATIIRSLQSFKANLSTKIIVIGGGVLQDIVGFCASIFGRGIDYKFIPTTLLAQADSCIGGKTSINFDNRKNILGTFFPPTDIFIYTKFCATLSDTDFYSGLGEIYKFHILQNTIYDFPEELNRLIDLTPLVWNALSYKSSILKVDEYDKNERRSLNFGHTFGHAIEVSSDHALPHGIAVIIGSMIAVTISRYLGYINSYEQIIKIGSAILKKLDFCYHEKWFNFERLLTICSADKKSDGRLIMVLLDNNKPRLQAVADTSLVGKSLVEVYKILQAAS